MSLIQSENKNAGESTTRKKNLISRFENRFAKK